MPSTKYPGLQSKFENSITFLYKGKDHFTMKDLMKSISENKENHLISDDEYAYLEKNLWSYVSRSCENNIIISLGKRKGYKIIEEVILDSSIQPIEEVKTDEKGMIEISREAFLHFPVTLLMSSQFKSRVISLPTKTTNTKWANPDMFMIRKNKKFEFNDELGLDLEVLKNVDSSPQLIISSIELKYGLSNRASILNALSETAINGSWANENWLVFYEESHIPVNFDEDCIDFAKANKIGVIKIKQGETSPKEYELSILISTHQKTILSLNSEFSESRKNLLKIIIDSIKEFLSNGSYMEEDGDYAKLSILIKQAIDNLLEQRQLPDQPSIFLENYEKYSIFIENKEYIKNLLPSLIGKDKLEKKEKITDQVGSRMVYADLANVLKFLSKFERD